MPATPFPFETDQPRVDVTLPVGTHVLELVVVDSAGIASEPDRVTVTVEREQVAARIDRITPSSGDQGTTLKAEIRGAGLAGATLVSFIGTQLPKVKAIVLDASQDDRLIAEIAIAADAPPQILEFTVTTPHGVIAAGVAFTVLPLGEPVATIDSIRPDTGTEGQQIQAFVLGQDLGPATAVRFSNPALVDAQVMDTTANQLTLLLTIGDLATVKTLLEGAEIAGNVADANGDGLGDNHTDLSGSAPVLMSSGVNASGGAGSNGIMRMHFEWDVSSLLGSQNDITSAQVRLHTDKGTVDQLDTFFFFGTTDQDGLLTDFDFQAPMNQIARVVMPVPDVPAGTDGEFSFDVLQPLQAALAAGQQRFSIQGRVDESLARGGTYLRGLQVRTTAAGNISNSLEPKLSITLGGDHQILTFAITKDDGTVLDSGSFNVFFTVEAVPIEPLPRLLSDVQGIGPTRSLRLGDANIKTVDDLANAEPSAVAEALDLSEDRAMGFIDAARKLIGS